MGRMRQPLGEQKSGIAKLLELAGNFEVSSSKDYLQLGCLPRQRWSCPAPNRGAVGCGGREAFRDGQLFWRAREVTC